MRIPAPITEGVLSDVGTGSARDIGRSLGGGLKIDTFCLLDLFDR
jgi:hypothetical protein